MVWQNTPLESTTGASLIVSAPWFGAVGSVAETVLSQFMLKVEVTAVPPGEKHTFPATNQLPAVREREVTSFATPVVRAIADPLGMLEDKHCPTLGLAAQVPVVRPVIVGAVSVGEVARTTEPEPVGVAARAVAIPAPNPVIPVETGRPVPFDNVIVGAVPNTILPEPVTGCPRAVITPVPAPVKPVDTGSPVALVNTPEEGTPSAGVTNAGEFANTIPPEPVTEDARAAPTPLPSPVMPDTGSPVAWVKTTEVGVPRFGVINVGDVASTVWPEPVAVVDPVPPLETERGTPSEVIAPRTLREGTCRLPVITPLFMLTAAAKAALSWAAVRTCPG